MQWCASKYLTTTSGGRRPELKQKPIYMVSVLPPTWVSEGRVGKRCTQPALGLVRACPNTLLPYSTWNVSEHSNNSACTTTAPSTSVCTTYQLTPLSVVPAGRIWLYQMPWRGESDSITTVFWKVLVWDSHKPPSSLYIGNLLARCPHLLLQPCVSRMVDSTC